MGFKNKKIIQFTPLDLNENTVETLFNRCLAKNTDGTIISSSLFPQSAGYKKPDTPITFSQEKIQKDKQNIIYLYGQLERVHDNLHTIYSTSGSKKYTHENWTTNSGTLMKLLHLGRAAGIMYHFNATSNSAALVDIEPTLSPRDPNFDEWYKGYEAKMKKAEGPTPDEK